MRWIKWVAGWLGLVAGATSAGCGGDDPAGSTGSIEISVDPDQLSLPQGGSGSVELSLTRGGGFSGAVTLAVSGLPTGVTVTLTPSQLTGTTASATLDVAVGATVAVGTYTLTVTATAQGVGQATTTYQLMVTPPSPGGPIDYRFCSESSVPVFFAYQNGSGPWQAVTGTSSAGETRFTFTLTQPIGGVLIVYHTPAELAGISRSAGQGLTRRDGRGTRSRLRTWSDHAITRSGKAALVDTYHTDVLYGSAAELAQDAEESCDLTQATKTITGNVVGVPAGSYGIISLGGSNEIFDGAVATNPVTFFDVPAGPLDLVASRTIPGAPPDRLIVLRDLNIPDGGSVTPAIDFDGPASSVPATATATVVGGAGEDLEIFTEVVTANGLGGLWFDLAPSPVASRPWAGLGAGAIQSGDFHGLIVFASAAGNSPDFRVAVRYVGPVANQTLTLGPALTAAATTQVAAGSYPRFRFQGTLPAEYNKGIGINLLGGDEAGNGYNLLASTAWLLAAGSALTFDLTMPDVSSLAGFPVLARLTSGTNDVTLDGFGFTGPGGFDLQPNLGSEFKAANKTTTISVP